LLKKGWILSKEKYPAYHKHPLNLALFLADSEHLGAAGRADTRGSRLAILHGNGFCAAHIFLRATLHAVSLHISSFLKDICYKQ
jgi:hypothetical protein